MGTMLPAARALDVALRHPQLFGAVAVQSPGLNAAIEREFARIAKVATADRPRVYLEWCERDAVSLGEAVDTRRSCRNLTSILESSGYDVIKHELPGGNSWEMLTTQIQTILERYLPRKGR